MTHRLLASLVLLAAGPMLSTGAESTPPCVIPQPEKMEILEGAFTVGPETSIVADREVRGVADFLAGLLRTPTGFELPIRDAAAGAVPVDCVCLRIAAEKKSLGPEGYELTVRPDRIVAEAPAEAGLFYAVQTLRQLLPAAVESENPTVGVTWAVPCLHIADKPRYQWRGVMLDPGHNFLDVAHTKKYIDTLALYKMNRLHWHLTDMGWAIEIKKYPELTNLENRTPITNRWRRAYGKCTHGFYTQEEVREILAYAAARHVMIVPEIEMPGHSTAALACYPELACPNWEMKTKPENRTYNSYRVNYCAGNEKTFEFLEDVLSEVIELFPSPIIHIGGDERRGGDWERCPLCQARIKELGLKDSDELQSYFIKRMSKFLAGKGRRLMGWTEINKGGLAPGAVLQSWLEPKHAVAAAQAGHDVVMSTNRNCYLNYQGLTTEKCYAWDPTPAELTPDEAPHILGINPCLWGFPQHRHDELLFPRLCAFAEVGWSAKESRGWTSFKTRLASHARRLDEMGINPNRDPAMWGK